jgi:anhydro-N-acetylmuramic acid kinase
MSFLPTHPSELVVCGGGVHNDYLMTLLKQNLPNYEVNSMATYGVDPDYVEAMLFAWLAKQAIEKKVLDLRAITGAKKTAILGGIYYP